MPSLVRLVAVLSIVATGFVSCNTDEEENHGEILPVEMAFTTGLPIMLITTPDSCSITSKTDWIKKAQIIIVGPYKTELLRTEADIKGRGNVTWRLYPKKPYSLKTNSRISILGMKAAKRWVLLANWADRTLLRNDVAFECARHTSLEWTPSGTFVELVLNGEYQGTYYLCEKIQIDTSRLNIGTNDAYLMEIDDHYDEVNKFKSGLFHLPYQFREPDDDELTEEQFTYMEHYVEGLEKSLANEDMLMNGEFENWIDPQSFVDWWIVNELCYNKDTGKPRSIFLHKSGVGKLTAGPVWDFDFRTFTLYEDVYVANHFPYTRRLFKNKEFQALAKRRWADLRPALDSIPMYIDKQAAKIRASADLNIRMWPITSKGNMDEQLSFDEAVDRMKQSLRLRTEIIDNYLSNF